MASTYLNVVNNVEKRLREPVSASVTTTDYSTLLGIFVNDAKRKIEDSYPWSEFRTTVSHSVVADDTTATLSGTTFRSKILWAYNDTKSYEITPGNSETARLNANMTSNSTSNDVVRWSPGGWDNDGQLIVNLYPKASGSATLLFGVYIPPDDLSSDSDVVRLPAYLVELGALILAVSERGEDGGALYDEVVQEYKSALARLMNAEQMHRPDEFDWSNDETWRVR